MTLLLIAAIKFPSSFHFQLYTAKLYKGRHEFLQLVPKREEGKAKEALKTFPLKGVNIKVTEKKEAKNFLDLVLFSYRGGASSWWLVRS